MTRAILAVHLGGHPADMRRINAVAARHAIPVIEDCAQAHGARCQGRSVGALGDMGAFSFQSSKNLTCGEGGAIVTNHPQLHERIISFQDVGRVPTGQRWQYHRLGWNYRPSEYLAALLLIRLEELEAQTVRRHENAAYLTRQLSSLNGITLPSVMPWADRHAFHLYGMLVKPEAFGGADRDVIVAALNAEGIPASAGYTMPLSRQPALKDLAAHHPEAIQLTHCPNTANVCAHSVWLPLNVLHAEHPDLDDVVTAIDKVQRGLSRPDHHTKA